jgi:superfamily II DNA or RNA helicase
MASIAQDQSEPGVLIAHRTELVSQISLTLARFGIYHNLIGSDSTIKFCIQQHIAELGRKFFNRSASVTVASVDTVKARAGSLEQWALQQKWWMVDEAHHCLTNNKWGSTALMLVNARGVGVTATPTRADRKSLHAEQGGVFHDMVLGPSMRDLIGRGMLCDYRIYAPAQSIDLSRVRIGSTGDYSQPGLREAAHESQIVGDVVQQYQRFAAGKRGITFTVDVDLAVEIAAAFNDAGIPAMAVSAKTNDTARASAVRRFRDGEILQLVNVDLFGEGFDVPAVEVVSMARPTASYGLFVQQFGRALRPLDGKSHGIIIDHAGNVGRHGLPDAPRQWRLWDENWGQRRRNADDVVIPVTTCTECFAAYERIHKVCPYCGHAPVPDGRSRPSQVDGDLIELDEATLRAMRGDIDRIDGDAIIPHGADAAITGAVKRRHRERQEAQAELRRVMALWGGVRRDLGEDDATMQRRFFHTFGIDVMSAQALGRPEAEELTQRIQKSWN